MGATQVVEPEQTPRPGSALVAVGIMAGIALVAAALVVAWARFGAPAPTAAEPQVIDAEVPESLAGGTAPGQVPAEIAAAVETPVVAAVRLEQLPADLEGCGEDFGVEDTRLESAIITPDAAIVAVVGSGEGFAAPGADGTGQEVRASCAGSWDGGWTVTTASAAPVGEVLSSTGGTGLADGTLLSLSTLLVPDGATWLVHDRGGYRLAYPVGGLPSITATVPSRPSGAFGSGVSSTPAVFLDDAGTVLAETFVGG